MNCDSLTGSGGEELSGGVGETVGRPVTGFSQQAIRELEQ